MAKCTNSELVNYITKCSQLSNDVKSQLIQLIKEDKKYGLIWENSTEAIEKQLSSMLPVFMEIKCRAIISENLQSPTHLLIEGDNLEALTTLAYTHEGQFDVIYIDPPYNTGNQDFFYNDSFVDKDDSYRHSKWLSFLDKRIRIAKVLLADHGLIIISIDDNEVSNLKLLCDSIFGESNCIGVLPTIMNLKGNQDQFGFAGTHEYTIVYAKSKQFCSVGQLDVDEEELDDWQEDEIGFYKKGATLKRTGKDAPREHRPYCYFPILINNQTLTVSTIKEDEYLKIYNPDKCFFDDDYVSSLVRRYTALGYSVLLPTIDGSPTSWRWGYKTVKANNKEIIVTRRNDIISLYKKQRPELGDIPTKKPKSVLYKAQYSSGNGTAQLKALSLSGLFNNPKPIDLIMDLLKIGGNKDALILDFFAGSGTTLHATMALNANDGGHRRCFLVTNNENNICEEVTYVRNKKVIEGYITPDGQIVPGMKDNTLRYFKTELVSRGLTHQNKRLLAHSLVDTICIKENCFKEESHFGSLDLTGKKLLLRFFKENEKFVLFIFDSRVIPFVVKEIEKDLSFFNKIKVYVFSDGIYPYKEDFGFVINNVELIPLPGALLNALKYILPPAEDCKVDETDLTEEEIERMAADAI